MTKKTNALIFRFGLSILWENKYIGVKNISNITQLENILYKELKKKNLSVLNIKYKFYFLNIFVYNNYQFDIKFKNQVISYYKKVSSLQKTTEKFGLNKKIILWFLNKNKIKKINLNLSLSNWLLIDFFFKFFFLCTICLCLIKKIIKYII